MTRTLPTRRLALVCLEAAEHLRALQAIHKTLALVVRDWGTQPPEAALAELRAALDFSTPPMPVHIPEAIGYLKASGAKLRRARNRARRQMGLEPDAASNFVPDIPTGFQPTPPQPSALLDLADIEAVLADLGDQE